MPPVNVKGQDKTHLGIYPSCRATVMTNTDLTRRTPCCDVTAAASRCLLRESHSSIANKIRHLTRLYKCFLTCHYTSNEMYCHEHLVHYNLMKWSPATWRVKCVMNKHWSCIESGPYKEVVLGQGPQCYKTVQSTAVRVPDNVVLHGATLSAVGSQLMPILAWPPQNECLEPTGS